MGGKKERKMSGWNYEVLPFLSSSCPCPWVFPGNTRQGSALMNVVEHGIISRVLVKTLCVSLYWTGIRNHHFILLVIINEWAKLLLLLYVRFHWTSTDVGYLQLQLLCRRFGEMWKIPNKLSNIANLRITNLQPSAFWNKVGGSWGSGYNERQLSFSHKSCVTISKSHILV